MEVVNPAEKEASEVLHSLLSVERRSVDSKDTIIVTIPSDANGGEYGEGAQWHTPVMGQHSVFELGNAQNMQQHSYNGHQEQVCSILISFNTYLPITFNDTKAPEANIVILLF